MKITVAQALQAKSRLTQSKLSNCTGDAAISLYFLQTDIDKAFEKHFKAFDNGRDEEANGLSERQKEVLADEEKITLTRGKLKLADIKQYATPVDLQVFEPFIDFK